LLALAPLFATGARSALRHPAQTDNRVPMKGKAVIAQFVQTKLSELEDGLKAGDHVSSDEGNGRMRYLLLDIARHHSAIGPDDREFIDAARYAVDRRIPWTL